MTKIIHSCSRSRAKQTGTQLLYCMVLGVIITIIIIIPTGRQEIINNQAY